MARFDFPRQADRDRLCLADWFRPAGSGLDVVALQIVTVGDELLERSGTLMERGDYSEGYYLHGFGVRLAEASAEYVHERVREELGIAPGRGPSLLVGTAPAPTSSSTRSFSTCYPHARPWAWNLTEAGALVPELSTAALVVHHPRARYFSV